MEVPNTEKAVFIGIIRQNEDERKVEEYLEELEFLAETAGAKGDRKFVQKLDKPEKATYIRSGKLQEIAEYCECNEIEYVIFDDEPSEGFAESEFAEHFILTKHEFGLTSEDASKAISLLLAQ